MATAGNNAAKEFDTAGGTPSGIFITISFSLKNLYISTDIIDASIAPKRLDALNFAIGIHLPAAITPSTPFETCVGTTDEIRNPATARNPEVSSSRL